MLKVINVKITLYYAVFALVSVIIITPITRHFLSFMLGFNVFLAYIPMFLIWYIMKLQKDVNYNKIRIGSIILFVIFVLFFPNTFYIITDLIHIDKIDFYQYVPTETYSFFIETTYMKDIIPFITIFQIAFAMILGIFAGVYSLYMLEELMVKQNMKQLLRELVIISILLLSSIGIYIGRFLRFFSWEILNPINILKELYYDASLFMLYFIVIFTVMQVILYYTCRSLFQKFSEK